LGFKCPVCGFEEYVPSENPIRIFFNIEKLLL